MNEIIENEIMEEIPVEPQRVNPFCVISIQTYGEYNVRDIQTSSAWSENPYEDYAVVPDDMYEAIMETRGFCDIELNEDGTEVVSFTALEIPEIPEPPHEPSAEERVAELEKENEALNSDLINTQLALTEIYEQLLILSEGAM